MLLFNSRLHVVRRLSRAGAQDGQKLIQEFASKLQECGNKNDLARGKLVHNEILENGYDGHRFLANLIVEMYGRCGSVHHAKKVFDQVHYPNVYSWTIMIAAFAQNGHLQDAVRCLRHMDLLGMRANDVTFVNVLPACLTLTLLRLLHQRITAEDYETEVISNTLIAMYAKLGSLEEARRVFSGMDMKSSVSWNVIMGAYGQHGLYKVALELYVEMDVEGVQPDRVTFLTVFEICGSLGALIEGRQVHARYASSGLRRDTAVENSLLKMYGKCGSLVEARRVFDEMEEDRDLITWTAIVSAYVQHGNCDEALKLSQKMDLEGIKLDEITYTSLLDACSAVSSSAHGEALLRRITESGLESNLFMCNCIVQMYAKCGWLSHARSVFDKMQERDTISWTTIIAAYAHSSHVHEAVELYREMDLQGMKPDEVTLTAILSACSHAGLLNQGWNYFLWMSIDHGLRPRPHHFACVVDLLGRAGKLEKAEEFIASMPVAAGAFDWTAFLGACKLHGDTDRAAKVSEELRRMDIQASSSYVLLSNVHAQGG